MNIRVAIADDEALIRKLFVSSLTQYEDIQVVGQATNGEEILKLLRTTPIDVLLLDLQMPRLSGLDVLDVIDIESIPVNTIIISMLDDHDSIRAAISAGALGFISKNEEWEDLYAAITAVSSGKLYNTNKLNSILLSMLRHSKQNGVVHNRNGITLTERELRILQHLNVGLNSSDIAEKLYCSRGTVDRARQELIHRFGVKNTTELISYAILHRLIDGQSQHG